MRMPNVVAAALAGALLSACMDQTPLVVEVPDAETSRESAFTIVDGGAGRLTVDAAGRRVLVAPPSDFCVDPTSVREEGEALFLLIGVCELSEAVGSVTALSLGRGPLFSGDRKSALDALEKLLATEAGREGVGMGGAAADIRIISTRRTEDTLFALIEDTGARVADAFGPRFWRSFTEVNGRAVIATVGVRGESSEVDNDMLLQLSRLVATIRAANPGAAPEGLARAGGAAPTG